MLNSFHLTKKSTAIIIGIFSVLGVALLIRSFAATVPAVSIEAEGYSSIAGNVTKISNDTTASNSGYIILDPSASPTPTPSATPTPSPTPTPTSSACGSAGATCTASEVATHNSPSDCWVIYDASYHNVTSFVSIHNGGPEVFDANACGKDITVFINGSQPNAGSKHRHSSTAINLLASYKIGPVVP